jgi:CheY-like chemotaxis protein
LRAIAQASVEAAASEVQQARHEVNLRLPAHPVWVQADPARMKQVMDNLLNNAIKYTPAGGSIEIEVGRRGEAGWVQVRDNGVGIPPAMLGSVFDLFTQVNQTLGRSNGGLGIGLALVKQLVTLHGGSVAAASEGAGQGSTFTLQVPLVQGAQGNSGDAVGGGVRQARQPRRVLVVDDNRDAADTIATAIQLAGHDVAVAYDGATGLALADRMKPECILLDVGMPGMDGHQVIRALRSHPEHRRCLVIALTGWGQEHDRASTRESGFDAHLVKPASVEAVMALLDGEEGGPGAA